MPPSTNDQSQSAGLPPPPPASHPNLAIPHKPVAPVADESALPGLIPDDASAPSVVAPVAPPAPPSSSPAPTPTATGVSIPIMPDVATPTQSPAVPPTVAQATVVTPPPPPPPPAPTLSLEEQIAQEEEAQRGLLEKRKHIEEESDQHFASRKALEDELAPILLDEKLAIERIEVLEQKRQATDDKSARRLIEEERWKEEETRRAIEERKWPVGEKLEAVLSKIKESEGAFKELLAEESRSQSRIAKLRIAIKQRDLEQKLSEITKVREATEAELRGFSEERAGLETQLRDMLSKDEASLKEEHLVDAKADVARTLYEERVLAEERRKLEQDRQEAEKKRWEAEDALPDVTHSIEESQRKLEAIKKEEAEVVEKLKALQPTQ